MNKTRLIIAEGTKEIRKPFEQIEKIIIPNSAEIIKEFAFSGCSSLTEITIPNSVTSIGNSAFSDCSSLASITIPNGVIRIGDCVFWGCKSLTEITIPNSVIEIGYSAFSHCESLKAIHIDKERGSLSLRYRGIPKDCKVYWKGEWDKEEEE